MYMRCNIAALPFILKRLDVHYLSSDWMLKQTDIHTVVRGVGWVEGTRDMLAYNSRVGFTTRYSRPVCV